MVEFADKKEADSFVRGMQPNAETELSLDTAKVVATVARPEKWCTCAYVETGTRRGRRSKSRSRGDFGWTRGAHYGWMLCTKCHKPSKAMVEHFVTTLLAGANDLTPEILGEGVPISPHQRWLLEGGTEIGYGEGFPVEDGKRTMVG
jgi:hypothetical protein